MSNNQVKQAIILAGGKGTRLSEQTQNIPKPLVRIGNIPVIVHIMNHLASYGVEEVVIAGGYKIEQIREYFTSDEFKFSGKDLILTKDGILEKNSVFPGNLKKITIADTGLNTDTAQRILKASKSLTDPIGPFIMTYGDTVSSVNLDDVYKTFLTSEAKLTLTAVPYKERFGILKIDPENNNKVTDFVEKSTSKNEFVNGGFMILDPTALDEIHKDDGDFSKDTLPRMQQDGLVSAHIHTGFWAAMDTQRDNEELNDLYDTNPELFNSNL